MNELVLSDDLIEITAEINSFKQVAGQVLFEIGKRLKHVKENDLVHGQWMSWLESVEISHSTAKRMIQAYEQFGNSAHAHHLPTSKIFELLSLPESVDRNEFISTPQTVPTTGDQKMVSDMSRDELREVKKALQEAERRAEQASNEARHWQGVAKSQPVRVETKTVEVIPEHVKRDLQSQKYMIEGLQSKLDETQKQLDNMRNLKNAYERDSKEYEAIKKQLNFLHKEKDDIQRQIESATALSGLAVKIDHFLKTELAPIRYSRALERLDSDVAVKNLTDIILSVEHWCEDMRRYLPEQNRIIVEAETYESAS